MKLSAHDIQDTGNSTPSPRVPEAADREDNKNNQNKTGEQNKSGSKKKSAAAGEKKEAGRPEKADDEKSEKTI